MIDQTDVTLQEVLSQVSSTEAITLLPWCISMAMPLCYISKSVSLVAHQDEGISIASESCPIVPESEPHSSPVSGPSGGLTPLPPMSPFPVFSIPDIPLDGTPWLGHSFAGLNIPP